MGIVSKVPGSRVNIVDPVERKRKVIISSSIVNNIEHSPQGLSSYASGATWVLDEYFRQHLLSEDNPMDFDDRSDGVLQQYEKILDMTVKVEQSSAATQDTGSTVFSISRTAIVHSGLRPYVGDVMVGNYYGKRSVVFRVGEVESLSISSETAYRIKYTAMRLSEDNGDYLNELRSRVVRTYQFDSSRLHDDSAPYIEMPTYKKISDLREALSGIISYYLDKFLSNGTATLEYFDENSISDPSVVRFFLNTITSDDDTRIGDIRRYGPSLFDDAHLDVYSGIIKRSLSVFKRCYRHRVVIDNHSSESMKKNRFMSYQASRYISLSISPSDPVDDHDTVGFFTGNDYLFRKSFLEDRSESMSDLESQIISFVRKRDLNLEVLLKLTEESYCLSDRDLYYTSPILMLLIKSASKESM